MTEPHKVEAPDSGTGTSAAGTGLEAPDSGAGTGAAGTGDPRTKDAPVGADGEGTVRTETARPDRSWGVLSALRGARELAVVVVVALVATALLRAFLVQAFFVPSGSMVPTIHIKDRILVSRPSHLARGEVVVFQDPGGWLSPKDQPTKPGPLRHLFEWVGVLPNSGHGYLVKRVVGLPGDHVVCCAQSGRLVINGKQIREPYINSSADASDSPFDVVVPAHRMFVLGDNRYVSGDSSRHLDRVHPNAGFVPESLVTGRAIAIVWPWKDRRVLRIPESFAGIPKGRTPPAVGVITSDGVGR